VIIPLAVCEEAVRLRAAFSSGLFKMTSRHEAWTNHGIDCEEEHLPVYDGSYLADGKIYFVGSDSFAYIIDVKENTIERT
jgi:hypothetical protein